MADRINFQALNTISSRRARKITKMCFYLIIMTDSTLICLLAAFENRYGIRTLHMFATFGIIIKGEFLFNQQFLFNI